MRRHRISHMTDLGVEPALDAEHGDSDVEFLQLLLKRYGRQRLSANFPRLLNFCGLLNKETKSVVKWQRKPKPNSKLSRQYQALRKRANNERAKYLKTEEEVRKQRLSEKLTNKIKQIEHRKSLLEKDMSELRALADNKAIEIDLNFQEDVEKTSNEIEKIKNNINEIHKKLASKKSVIDQETKTLKITEAREVAGIEKRIEEMDNTLEKSRDESRQRIEAKKKQLAMEKERFQKRVQEIKEEEAKITNQIDKVLNNFIVAEANEKQKMNDNIAKKRKTLDEAKKELEKNFKAIQHNTNKNINALQEAFTIQKDLFLKNIQVMQQTEAEKKREIGATIQKLLETAAQKKAEMDRHIILMQEDAAKITSEIKAEIQRMNEIKAAEKDNIMKNIEAKLKSLEISKVEFDNNIKEMRQYEVERTHEIEAEIQRIKAQKKQNIEKTIEALGKKLRLNAKGVIINHTSAVCNTRSLIPVAQTSAGHPKREYHSSGPPTSSGIVQDVIDLTDEKWANEDTSKPNDASMASTPKWPCYWQQSRLNRD